MALRKVLAACAALALTGVDASRCRLHPSHSISSSTVIESSTVVSSSSTAENSEISSSTTVSEAASSSITISETASSSTAESSGASSSTAESSATISTSDALPTSTGYLSNPGFDNGGTSWTITGGGSINIGNQYHNAPDSAYLYVERAGQDAAATVSTSLRNLVPGKDYEVSMYSMISWFSNIDVCTFVIYIDDQAFPRPVQYWNSWVPLSQPFTAPKADPVLKIQLWCSSIPWNGESDWESLVSLYVDDVAVAEVENGGD